MQDCILDSTVLDDTTMMSKNVVEFTLVEVQWGIERVRERRLSDFGSNVSRMTCLDTQDGRRGGKVVFVHDGRGSPSVPENANQRTERSGPTSGNSR